MTLLVIHLGFLTYLLELKSKGEREMQAKRKTGLNPLGYLGVEPITPPQLIIEDRDPTSNDNAGYNLGSIWMVPYPTKIWMMVNKEPSVATKWVQIYPGDGSGTNFFTTDSGIATQVGGNVNVYGTNDIQTMASAVDTITIGLEPDVTINNSLKLVFEPSAVLITDATGQVDGATGTDKQILMWETAGGPGFHTVTSDDGTVNFEWSIVTPGAISITSIGGGGGGFGGLVADDTNTAVPSASKVNVFGDTINTTTTASGSTLTVHLNDMIKLPSTNSAGSQGIIQFNSKNFISSLGTDNTFIGEESGNLTLTTGSATGNTGLGTGTLLALTTSADNTGIGVGSLTLLESGTGGNSCLGALSGSALVDGTDNLLLGKSAGINYTSESKNICLMNQGTALDVGVIRIGNNTDHAYAYMSGIYGTSSGATNGIVTVGNDGKLGSTNGSNGQVMIGGGTGPAWASFTSSDSSIIFTPGANTLDMVAVGGGGSSGIVKLGADSGTPALPLLGEVDIYGGTNINTVTAPNAVVVNLDEWIDLPVTNAAGTQGGISLGSVKYMHAMGTDNTFLGKNAGNLALTVAYGNENVGIGTNALTAINRNSQCTAVGFEALKSLAATTSTTGDYNTAIGHKSLTTLNYSGSGSLGSYNTALGASSGLNMTNGVQNTLIGMAAGDSITSGDNNLCLGYSADVFSATDSNKVIIGNSSNTGGYYLRGMATSSVPPFVTVGANGLLGISASAGSAAGKIMSTYTSGGVNYGTWASILSGDSTISVTPSAINGNIDIRTAGTKVAFHAYQSGNVSNATGDGTTYLLGVSSTFTEVYDYNSNFYPGSGTGTKALFTAPKTGLYEFICTVLATGLPSGATTRVDPIYIYTSNRTYQLVNPVINYSTTSGQQTITFTVIADMDSADTAYFGFGLQTSVGTKTVGIGASYTTLSGFFIA